jgi:hypothetical protein
MRTFHFLLSSFSKDLPSVAGVFIGISYRKLESPILEILVGPDRNVFKVHRAMLTEASDYLKTIFLGRFKAADECHGLSPEDDPEAWELLIEWCCQRQLPPLQIWAKETKLTSQMARPCSLQVKLCLLAEKYRMSLLLNLSVDSMLSYLKHVGPGLRLEWVILDSWCRLVYTNNDQLAGIRRFMGYYFYYALI